MFCPTCGTQLVDGAICQSCPSVRPEERSARISVADRFRIGGVIFLAAVNTFFVARTAPRTNEGQGYVVGSFVGFFIIPTIVAYLVGGRSSNRNWKRFSWTFLLVGIFVMFAQVSSHVRRSQEEQTTDASRLIKLALNEKADISALSNRQAFGVRILREIFAKKKAYLQAVSECKVEPEPLSVESLDSRRAMEKTISSTQTCFQLDFDYVKDFTEHFASLPTRMRAEGWKQSEIENYMEGFEASFADVRDTMMNTSRVEKLWLSSLEDFYNFSIEHSGAITVNQGHIIIRDHSALLDFNAKLNKAKELQKQF
jgi:hypothetical protein